MLKKLRDFIIPLTRINQVIPSRGLVYEIGSGYGGLSQSLATIKTREVIGIDFDERKIEKATLLVQNNLKFILADAISYRYKKYSGAVLSDFLHHITYKNQEFLLRQLYQKLEKNGVICIKEISANDTWRVCASRLWDFILYPRDTIYYRRKTEWVSLLQSMGFKVKVERKVVWFPGSTWLFVCSKI